jgi:hypothetical protein
MKKITAEDIAALCHEANRAYCSAIGDDSHLPWDAAPDWQRNSAVNGVVYHVNNPNATPENSHENWLKQKIAEGWKYGEVKDPDKKEHPCCVPYADLPTEQKAKDYIYRSIIRTFLERGFAVELSFQSL